MRDESDEFSAAVREYSAMAYQVAYRILWSEEDAKEVVQESFVKLYKNWPKYSAQKNLKNWIYTITLNTARDYYRKFKRLSETPLPESLPESTSESGDDRLLVKRFLTELPIELKEVVILYYIEGRVVADIQQILGVSESLVKVRLYRARKLLIDKFGRELDAL